MIGYYMRNFFIIMINKIWYWLIVLGIFIAFFSGNGEAIANIILTSSKTALQVYISVGMMIIFWSGIFEIAIKSGLITNIAKLLRKPLTLIFPMLRKEEETLELIACNMIANFLGLGSASTSSGLKVMNKLAELNEKKDIASRAMIIFVIINASAPTLFPTTIYGLRSLSGATTTITLFLLMITLSLFSCITGLLLERLFNKVTER